MADILLQKPEAGQATTLTPAPEDRLVFEFNSGDALLTRVDDNLVMSFEDGSSLTLTDFYVAYTSENMPEFVIGDEVVPGEAFFAALGEDLMPAAGPGAGPQGGGTTVDTISPSLLDAGLDSLSGRSLNLGSRAAGEGFDSISTTDAPPTINGVIAFADAGPDASPNALDVFESGVGRDVSGALSPNIPNQQYAGDFVASGRIDATDPEGLDLRYSIEGSGVGTLGSIAIDADTGEFVYTFTGDAASDSLAQGETRQEIFTAVVEDPAGNSDTVQIVITVTGTNDRPTFTVEGENVENLSVTDGFNNPHIVDNDGMANSVTGNVVGDDVDTGATLSFSVSHINPNLLDQAIYDDLAEVLAQVRNFKDGVTGSPVVEGLGDVLAQFEATDFTAYLEKVSESLPKIEEALDNGLANILGNVTNAADTSAAMQEVTDFLHGEFGKLDDLVGHPISETIVGKFTDLMNTEIGKLPLEADKLDVIVQGLMKSLQDILTDSLSDLFDKFQADFDALVAQIGALEDFADNHPLSEIIANANATVDGFLGQLQDAVDNANANDYLDASTLPTTAIVANGLYGKLELDSADSGNFTYTLYTEEEAKAMGPEFEAAFWALQMRDDNEQALDTEHFTVYVSDEYGAWNYKNISIDVMGKNDAPVIHYANDMTVQESGNGIIVDDKFLPNAPDLGMPAAVGQVVASDIDVEKLTFTVEGGKELSGNPLFDTVITNDYGSLYLNSDTGTYSFVLNNGSDATQALNEGETKVFEFTFSVSDGDVSDDVKVKLTIEGTNDQPTLTLDKAVLTVTEDGALNKPEMEQASGQAIGQDADLHPSNDEDGSKGEVLSYSIEYARPELTLVQEMANVLKVLGVNVNEEALDAVANMTEQAYEALGTNTGSATELNGLYGKLSIDPDSGEYTYELYTEQEAKDLGPVFEVAYWALKYRDDNEAALNENFTVTVKDDLGAWNSESLTVEVYGSNDKPVILAANNLTVQEAGEGIVVGDKFLPNALDLGKPAAVGQILAIDDINDMINNLEFNIVGGTASEGSLNLADLTGIDLDALGNVDAFPYDYTISHDFGDLYLNKDTGTYIFVVDQDAADKLNEGEDVSFNFSFTVTDGDLTSEAKEITVTLEGTNDRPEFSVSEIEHDVYEFLGKGGSVSFAGKAEVTDADAGDTQAFSVSYALPEFSDIADIFNLDGTVAGQLDGIVDITKEIYQAFAEKMPASADAPAELNGLYGSLSLAADGSYTYTLYTWEQAVELGPVTMAAYVALQKRGDGDDALPTENFIVRVEDGKGAWDSQELSFNVMGTNDGPVINGDLQAGVTEAGVGSSLSDDMVDGIIESTIGQITTGNETVNELLKLLGVDLEKFTLDLEASLKESLDGKFGTLSDANALPNADVAGKDTAMGTITVTDDDSSSFGSSPLVLLDGAKPEFKADVLLGKLTASVLNGELSIDLTALGSIVDVLKGFADLPKILEGGVSVDEIRDLLQSASELSNIVDIFDNGFDISVLIDSIKESFEYTQEGEYGTLTLTPDVASGSYTYTYELNNDDEDTQSLGEKEVGQDSFTVKSYDIYGNETTQEITINVEGKNDRPVLSLNDGPIVLTENDEHSYTVKGTATADDADTTAELKYFVSAAAPIIDEFAETLQGILGESNDPNAPSIAEALGDQISAWLTAEVALGAAKGLEEVAKVAADLTDATALRATADSLQAQYDSASWWQQGALWVPLQVAIGAATAAEASDAAYANAQAATAKAEEARDDVVDGFDKIGESGFSLDSIKEYLDKDGDGQLDAEFINADGAPELSLPGSVSSNLVTREVDGENQTFDVQEGKYGTLEINVNTGEYTYVVDPKFNDDIQALGEGEKFEESFVIYVQDENGAWDSKEITVTINGTDDAPQIKEETATLTVDESYLASGTKEGETPAAGEASTVAKGTVEFTSAEDMAQGTITVGGVVFTVTKNDDGSLTLTNKDGFEVSSPDYGFITVDPKVTYDAASKTYTLNYTYTQDTVFDHGTSAENDDVAASADSFTIDIKDGKGDATDSITVNVDIKDDAPIVSLDEGAIIKAGTVHTGTWSVDLGADGGAYQISFDGGKTLRDVEFGKTMNIKGLGKLTIESDGTYTFDSNNKTQGEDFSFTLSATDSDGDVVSDTVTISMLSKLVVDTTSSAVIVIDASSGDLSAVESAIKQAGNAQVVLFGSQSDIDKFDMSALSGYDVKLAGSSSDLTSALTVANGIVDSLAAASSQPVNVVVACNGDQPVEVANMPNTVKFGDIPQDGHWGVVSEILFDISGKQPGDSWTSKGVAANIIGDKVTEKEYELTLGVDKNGNLFVTATVVGGNETVSTSQFSEKMLESFDSTSTIKWPGFDYASAEEQARLAAQEAAEKALKDLNDSVENAGGELVVVGDHSLDLPKKVSTDLNDLEESIDGSKVGDILVGGMTTEDLQAVTGKTDEEDIIRTLQQDPEWLTQQDLSAYDDGGDDTINAGKGNDIAYGGAGDDTIYGGKGADSLFGGEGDDSIYGGKGADSIYGGAGADLLDGGTGDDIFFADVKDTVLGGDGNDLIIMSGFDSVNIDDVLSVDGGNGIDILLSGVTSLMDAEKLINNSGVSNVEIMMFGKDGADADAIEAAKALQEQLQGKDEKTGLTDADLTGWTNKGSSIDGYTQFESEDDKMTILIQSSLINS